MLECQDKTLMAVAVSSLVAAEMWQDYMAEHVLGLNSRCKSYD
jgi:hypothetical protein